MLRVLLHKWNVNQVNCSNLGVPVLGGETGLLLLAAKCTGTWGPHRMCSATNCSGCIGRFSWRILNKLYWSLAGSPMRYSKESGWLGVEGCKNALGRTWRLWSLGTVPQCPLPFMCLVWNGQICCPQETYFGHDFQKLKELKQHYVCKTEKKALRCL